MNGFFESLKDNIYIYLLLAAVTLYLMRLLPLTLIRREIKNKFLRSFLHYVPYVTLSVMTVPAIIYSTNSIYSGTAAFVAGLAIAFFDGNLFKTAAGSCLAVLAVEGIMQIMGA